MAVFIAVIRHPSLRHLPWRNCFSVVYVKLLAEFMNMQLLLKRFHPNVLLRFSWFLNKFGNTVFSWDLQSCWRLPPSSISCQCLSFSSVPSVLKQCWKVPLTLVPTNEHQLGGCPVCALVLMWRQRTVIYGKELTNSGD